MTKRKILLGALAVCLVAALAAGTLAYFTASDTATNTFMTATTDPDNPDDPLFGIDITEDPDPDDPDPAGEQKDPTKPDRTYEDVLPGQRYSKQPVITNVGQYDAYVRAQVTFDKTDVWANTDNYLNGHAYDTAALRGLLGTLDASGSFVAGVNSGWELTATEEDAAAHTVTFTYTYNQVLAPDAAAPAVFTKVLLPTELDVAQLAALNGDDGFHITVFGEAIQAANTAGEGNDADTIAAAQHAFGLYDAQMEANANP